MTGFRFAVGNEQEDGLFLLNGFSVPCERTGRMCRSCAMVFEMRLPACRTGALKVTLSMLVTDPALEIRFSVSEKHVYTARPTTEEWAEYSFVVAEDAPRDDGCISLRGEMNVDPAFPPVRVAAISEVRLSSVDGGEIELRADMAADKICQYPMKITSMYRSYHEGHKMRPLFGDRLWKFRYSSEKKIFFGDVHVHTDYSRCGHGHNKGLPLCVEMATGKIAWGPHRGEGSGSAAVTYADGHLYFRYQDGTMVLIAANPDKYEVKGKFKIGILNGKSWPHPVIADGMLYLRDQDELIVYDVRAKK